jgi:hypothetical protein
MNRLTPVAICTLCLIGAAFGKGSGTGELRVGFKIRFDGSIKVADIDLCESSQSKERGAESA